ncbi:MAG: beta-ketoacyl-ACP synthase II [bacterium]|nr:beta-ketoacyl-ACP synthase II [bacterium]
MRRVVVTGVGLVSPLGGNAATSWKNLIAGKSGIRTIENWDLDSLPVTIAGQVPYGDSAEGLFNPDDWMLAKERRKTERFILYAVAASAQALQDAEWSLETDQDKERTGVSIGSGIGGLHRIYENSVALHEGGSRKVNPFFIPGSLVNLAAGQTAIHLGIKGPNHATVTACSAGAHAIGDASRMIRYGDADVMVAGGAEAAVCPLGIAGFNALRALSTRNDAPQEASRPWDQERDGFVMGEGAGILVLEEREHAKKRGAKIYAELVGYGLSGDANHVTAPAEDGNGAYRAMESALRHAKISPENVDYVNAHGTSTPLGDVVEARAVQKLLGAHANKVSMSSTKSAIGHLLGGSGGAEAVFTILAMRDQVAPPTLNLHNPATECAGMDLVPMQAKERPIRIALSNSFGFGGTNASLVFKASE